MSLRRLQFTQAEFDLHTLGSFHIFCAISMVDEVGKTVPRGYKDLLKKLPLRFPALRPAPDSAWCHGLPVGREQPVDRE